jgi:SOS-response transcriptional repressor LexA
VIAVIGGEFWVKRLIIECGVRYLVPDNPYFGRIELGKGDQAEIWGSVHMGDSQA